MLSLISHQNFLALDGPMSDVVQLRSTPPLFKAYEEIYSSMESKYCPSFFKSEEVSQLLFLKMHIRKSTTKYITNNFL